MASTFLNQKMCAPDYAITNSLETHTIHLQMDMEVMMEQMQPTPPLLEFFPILQEIIDFLSEQILKDLNNIQVTICY